MSYIDESSYEFNPTSRRYGSTIDYDLITFLAERSPIAYYLCYGIVEEALIYGFNAITNGEVDERLTDEIQDAEWYDEMIDTASKILGTSRLYGWSVAIPFKDARREYPKIYIFDMGTDAHAEVIYKGITPVSVDYQIQYDLIRSLDTIQSSTSEFLFTLRENKKIGSGKSYLYPIFDDLIMDLVLSQSTGLYLTRLGGGIKKLKVPLSFFHEDNEKLRSNTLKNLESLGYNTNFIFPAESPDGEYEFEIYTGSGPAMNIKEAQEFYLNRISLYTGIPRSKLVGSELGLRSSETNYEYHSTQIQNIRRDLKKIIKWLIPIYDASIELQNLELRENEAAKERDKIEILKDKVEILKQLVFLKVPKDQIKALLSLDIDFDDSVMEFDNNQNQDNNDEEDNNTPVCQISL